MPEDACVGNPTQEVGVVNTIETEEEAALRQFERERNEDSWKIIIAWHLVGDTFDVKMIQVELDNYLFVADGEWWDDNDLCLAHTDEE